MKTPSAPGPSGYTGLQINFTTDPVKWIGVQEMTVLNVGVEQFTGLIRVDGAPGNNYATLSDDEYTSDSDYEGGISVARIQNGNIMDDTQTAHWSDNGTVPLNVFIRWASAIEFDTIKIRLQNTVSYSLPTLIFKDENGDTITIATSPADVDDYEDGDKVGGTGAVYAWTF